MENINMNQADPEGLLAIAIPIVAIVFGLSLAMLRSWLDYKKKKEVFELHHRERMAAIEKGLEVPALPAELFANTMTPNRQRDPLRSGLIWTLVGAAISIAWFLQDKDHWAWGLVPAAVGIANLLYYIISRRESDQSASTH
jgi:hypothetical protein